MMFQPPPPQPPPSALVVANKLPVLKFYSNPENRKFKETIRSSLVFHDAQGLGPIFIQTHLRKLYPIQGWTWVARALPQNRYLIEHPNLKWKNHILSHEVVLGGVSFIVEMYDIKKFDGGTNSIHIWVNITGLPPDL
jgi:hypothetical protein